MKLIEALLGVSPDAGNGMLELLLFVVPVAAAIFWLRFLRTRS